MLGRSSILFYGNVAEATFKSEEPDSSLNIISEQFCFAIVINVLDNGIIFQADEKFHNIKLQAIGGILEANVMSKVGQKDIKIEVEYGQWLIVQFGISNEENVNLFLSINGLDNEMDMNYSTYGLINKLNIESIIDQNFIDYTQEKQNYNILQHSQIKLGGPGSFTGYIHYIQISNKLQTIAAIKDNVQDIIDDECYMICNILVPKASHKNDQSQTHYSEYQNLNSQFNYTESVEQSQTGNLSTQIAKLQTKCECSLINYELSSMHGSEKQVCGSGSCHNTCATCSGPNANDCCSCDTNATLTGLPGTCTCNAPYYFDGSTYVCQRCHLSCSSCTSGTVCDGCSAAHSQLNTPPDQCICQDPYFDSDTSDSINCQQCHQSCSACNLATGCTACYATNSSPATPTANQCVCDDGWYDTDSTDDVSCSACPGSCATCHDNDFDTNITCVTCNDQGGSSKGVVSSELPDECVCDLKWYDTDADIAVLSCSQCHSSCETCVGPDYWECSACLDCRAQVNGSESGRCICGKNSYNSGIGGEVACIACHVTCNICTDAITCSECKDDNAIHDTANPGKCKCDTGFIDGNADVEEITCETCHSSCDGCTLGGPSGCSACVDTNAAVGTGPPGSCVCNTGYYDADGTDEVSCVLCPDTCTTCHGDSSEFPICDTCEDPNSQAHVDAAPNNNRCVCNSAYYDDQTNAPDLKCLACHASCSVCSYDGSSVTCITCADVNGVVDPSATDTCVCKFGYNDADAGAGLTCQGCHTTCATCAGSGANQCNSCTDPRATLNATPGTCTCPNGYYNKLSGTDVQCLRCPPGCGTCTNNSGISQCQTCKNATNASLGTTDDYYCECDAAFYDDGTDWPNLNCVACHGDCATCKAPGKNSCRSCADANASLVGSPVGFCECDSGYYNSSSTNVISCTQCDGTCSTCTYDGTTVHCSTCAHADAESDTSVCICKDGFYDSDTDPQVINCIACHGDCLTCDGGTNSDCTACKDPNATLGGGGSCTCNSTYYNSDATGLNMNCTRCPDTCDTCTGSGGSPTCSTCINASNSVLNGSNTACICSTSFYDNLIASPNIFCVACDPTCADCSYDGTTLTCDTCVVAANSIRDDPKIPERCVCPTRKYDDGTSGAALNCVDCHGTCENCISGLINGCTECRDPNAILDSSPSGTCSCKPGYYDSDTTTGTMNCIPCPSTCARCNDTGSGVFCTQCYYSANALPDASGGTCSCMDGYYDNLSFSPDLYCVKCHENCSKCATGGASGCTECADAVNTNVLGSPPQACSCKSGFYDNNTSDVLTCMACPNSCNTCTFDGTNLLCTCTAANSHPVGGRCACDALHYDADSTDDINCLPCHATCQTCDGTTASDCLTCADGNAELNGAVPNTCLCRNRFWGVAPLDGTNCVDCPDTCETCHDNAGTAACDTCWFPTFAELNTPATTCKCSDGYYNDASLAPDLKCVPCPGDTCSTCTKVGANINCTQCKDANSSPIAAPGDTSNCNCNLYFFDDLSQAPELNCVACHNSCATCNSAAATNCLTCRDSNSHLLSGLVKECVCQPGFWDSDNTDQVNCQACPNTCATCKNNGSNAVECETCRNSPNAKVKTGVLNVCECKTGFYNDGSASSHINCLQCHANCTTCSAGGHLQCDGCNDANAHLNGGPPGQCVCDQGYYDSDTTNGVNCVQCPPTCADCTYNGVSVTCFTCFDPGTQDTSGSGCVCKNGYYDDEFFKPKLNCQACHSSCNGCDAAGPNACLACADGNASLNRAAPTNCVCNDTFYDSDSSHNVTCTTCPNTCDLCHDNFGTPVCDTCKNTLNAKVDDYPNNNQCTCTNGYKDDQTLFPSIINCTQTCTDQNCVACKMVGAQEQCKSCSHPNAIPDLTTIGGCKCADGYYSDGGNPFSCLSCYSSCATCSGPQPNKCNTCKDPNAQLSGSAPNTCVCKSGFFDTIPEDGVECQGCSVTCSGCTFDANIGKCSGCSSIFAIVNPNRQQECICQDGYYNNDPTGFNCVACHSSCSKCSAAGENGCTGCVGNNTVVNGSSNGKCKCADYYYEVASGGGSGLTCAACDSTCKTCAENNGVRECSVCGSEYAKVDISNPEKCICVTGFYNSATPDGFECSCQAPLIPIGTTCRCPDFSYHLGIDCICVDGYINVSQTSTVACVPCSSNCTDCFAEDGEAFCNQCQGGYSLSADKKECSKAMPIIKITNVAKNIIIFTSTNLYISTSIDLILKINKVTISDFSVKLVGEGGRILQNELSYTITVHEPGYEQISGDIDLKSAYYETAEAKDSYYVPYVAPSTDTEETKKADEEYSEAEKEEADNLGLAAEWVAKFTVTCSVVLLIMTENPTALWSLVYSIQILSYIPMMDIDLPIQLVKLLASFTKYIITPNAFEYMMSEESNERNNLSDRNYFETNDFLLNFGKHLTIILFLLVLLPIFRLLSSFQRDGFFKRLCKLYKWNVFLRFGLVAYLPVVFSAQLQFFSITFGSFAGTVNQILAFASFVRYSQGLAILAPIVLLRYYRAYNISRNSEASEGIQDKFQTLHYEFDKSNPKKAFFNVWFLVRRFIYVQFCLYLIDYPVIQAISNILHCIIVNSKQNTVIVAFSRPYSGKFTNILMIITECAITSVFIMCSLYLFDINSETRDVLMNFIITVTFGIVLMLVCFVVGTFVSVLFKGGNITRDQLLEYQRRSIQRIRQQQRVGGTEAELITENDQYVSQLMSEEPEIINIPIREPKNGRNRSIFLMMS